MRRSRRTCRPGSLPDFYSKYPVTLIVCLSLIILGFSLQHQWHYLVVAVFGHAVLRPCDRQHRHRRLATQRAGSGEISAWTTASRNGVGLHKGRGTGLEWQCVLSAVADKFHRREPWYPGGCQNAQYFRHPTLNSSLPSTTNKGPGRASNRAQKVARNSQGSFGLVLTLINPVRNNK